MVFFCVYCTPRTGTENTVICILHPDDYDDMKVLYALGGTRLPRGGFWWVWWLQICTGDVVALLPVWKVEVAPPVHCKFFPDFNVRLTTFASACLCSISVCVCVSCCVRACAFKEANKIYNTACVCNGKLAELILFNRSAVVVMVVVAAVVVVGWKFHWFCYLNFNDASWCQVHFNSLTCAVSAALTKINASIILWVNLHLNTN